jgi:hypothetical protein
MVLGLVASAMLFGGWWGKKEQPLLPANAFLAAYATDATKDVPVVKEFGRVFDAKSVVLSELMKELSPGSSGKIDADPFQTYFAIDHQAIEWSLFAMGELTRSAQMSDTVFPDMTWALCGPFNPEKTIATFTKRLQVDYPGAQLEASTLNGTPVWTVKGEAINKVHGLNPCIAFSGKRLMLVASNEKALRNLLDLYAGKVPGLPKDASLSRLLEPQQNMVSRLMLVNVNSLITKLTTERERVGVLTDPKVSAVVGSLRDWTIETRLVPGRDAAELVMRMDCADEGNAQTLNELCITAKTSASFLLSMTVQQRPELKAVLEWLSKISSRVEGKQTTLSLQCSPQDIQNLDMKKIFGRQGKRPDAGEKNKEATPQRVSSSTTGRSE